MIEIDVNGTKVKVPVSSTKAGTSDIRMYAIITNRGEDGATTSFALNLGEIKLNGRSLKDILNSDGESIINEIIPN
jgi:hypothetical protein